MPKLKYPIVEERDDDEECEHVEIDSAAERVPEGKSELQPVLRPGQQVGQVLGEGLLSAQADQERMTALSVHQRDQTERDTETSVLTVVLCNSMYADISH